MYYGYICNDCGEYFDEPNVVDESFLVPYGETSALCPFFSEHCPYCGSEGFAEANECEICGHLSKGNYCTECDKELYEE